MPANVSALDPPDTVSLVSEKLELVPNSEATVAPVGVAESSLIAANVALPFAQARAMPKSVYTAQEFLDAELSHIFGKEWYCVGRASSLANPGDYITFELANQPLMVMRGMDGTLRAQSNVCLHRMSTLLEGRGNKRIVTCPYHGWSYETDGKLRGALKVPAAADRHAIEKAALAHPECIRFAEGRSVKRVIVVPGRLVNVVV